MDSAAPVETMAMNNMIKISTAPVLPRSSVATAGGTKPSPASWDVIGSISAVDANPNDVARENGIENQQILRRDSKKGSKKNLPSNVMCKCIHAIEDALLTLQESMLWRQRLVEQR
jgi:hypothetical protein